MKLFVITIVLALTTLFVKQAISDDFSLELIPKNISCLMGDSQITEDDYPVNSLSEKADFFSRVATQSINLIIKNKPYDQKGTEFSIKLLEIKPELTGYIVIKESYQQINLKEALCEKAIGNYEGFKLSCLIKSPIDNQNLFLNYIYKYKSKLGVFNMKVSKTKVGLLTKNIFACEHN